MKEYQILIVDFFTEAKKLGAIKAETHEELQEKVAILGKKNPTCIIVAYFGEEIHLGTRPIKMMEELEKAKEGEIPAVEFALKWRVLPSGEQILPDYSLPKIRKKVRKQVKVASVKPTGRRQKPHRAEFKEVVPQEAGV